MQRDNTSPPVSRTVTPVVREQKVVHDEKWFALRRTELFNWMNRRDKTVHQCLDHAHYTIESFSKYLVDKGLEKERGS